MYWKTSSRFVFIFSTDNGLSCSWFCLVGSRDICFLTIFGTKSPFTEYTSVCCEKRILNIKKTVSRKFSKINSIQFWTKNLRWKGLYCEIARKELIAKYSQHTYRVQIVNDPFVNDINMRINEAAVHCDFAVSMQEMVWQVQCFLVVASRCEEGQTLCVRLNTNQVSIFKKMKKIPNYQAGNNEKFQISNLPCLCLALGPGTMVSASNPPLNICVTIEALFCRKWFNMVNRSTFVIVSHDTSTKSHFILKIFKHSPVIPYHKFHCSTMNVFKLTKFQTKIQILTDPKWSAMLRPCQDSNPMAMWRNPVSL